MAIPTAFRDLLASKESLVAWYPFCEGLHTTGYTPNVADQSDSGALALALTDFGAGETCGDERAYFTSGAGSGYGHLESSVKAALQITGEITIIFTHSFTEFDSYRLYYCMCGSGAGSDSNTLYRLSRLTTGFAQRLWHESGNQTPYAFNPSGYGALNDGVERFYCMRRFIAPTNYYQKLRIGDTEKTSGNDILTHLPSDGSLAKLNIPVNADLLQANGIYKGFMIFNEALTDAEIEIIKAAGTPAADWFDYSEWNSATGAGSVLWATPSPDANTRGIYITEHKDLLGFKLESTPYTPETLTTAEYSYHAYDLKVAPDIESTPRQEQRGDFSNVTSISGKRSCAVNFKVDLYAQLFDNDAPKYFDMLRACGWAQTSHGNSGVSVKPSSIMNRVPATIEVVYEDESEEPRQLVYKISGAMGNVKFVLDKVGKPIAIEFSFIGALEGITTLAYADRITASTFDAGIPIPAMSMVTTLFGSDIYPLSLEISSGEVVNLFSGLMRSHGYAGARVADRLITGKIVTPAVCDEETIDATIKGWWKGENNPDDSIADNTAIWTGTARYIADAIGYAFDFWSTDNNYLTISYLASQALTAINTWSVEFYFTRETTGAASLFRRGAPGTTDFDIQYTNNGNDIQIYVDNGVSNLIIIYAGIVSPNTRYLLKAKSTIGVWQLWIDDIEQIATGSATIIPASSELEYRVAGDSNHQIIDEIKIRVE